MLQRKKLAEQIPLLLENLQGSHKRRARPDYTHVLAAMDLAPSICTANYDDNLSIGKEFLNADVHHEALLYQLSRLLRHESLVVSTNERLGSCYHANRIEVGDRVVLIEGASFPLIVREAGMYEGRRCFNFIGPARIAGMMDGELWPKNPENLEEIAFF